MMKRANYLSPCPDTHKTSRSGPGRFLILAVCAAVFVLFSPDTRAAYSIACGGTFEFEFTDNGSGISDECCFNFEFTHMPDAASGYVLERVELVPKAPASVVNAMAGSGYGIQHTPASALWWNWNPTQNIADVGEICLRSGDEYLEFTLTLTVIHHAITDPIVCSTTIRLCCGCEGDPNTPCRANRLNLTTGTTGWEVVNTVNTWNTPPYPAVVIDKHPSWSDPAPGSAWISTIPTAENDEEGFSVLERCFCVLDATEVRLYMEARAEFSASISINGHSFGSTIQTSGSATPDIFDDTIMLDPGIHCVEITLFNYQTGLLGFSGYGFLETLGPGYLSTDECCELTGDSDDPGGLDRQGTGELPDGASATAGRHVYDLNAAPNPSMDMCSIRFNLDREGIVHLGLYDVNGKRLRNLAEGWRNSGSHSLDVTTSGIAPGMYFVRLSVTGGNTVSIPLAVGL